MATLQDYLADKSRTRHSRAPSPAHSRSMSEDGSVILHDYDNDLKYNDDDLAEDDVIAEILQYSQQTASRLSRHQSLVHPYISARAGNQVVEKEGWLWRRNQLMVMTNECFILYNCILTDLEEMFWSFAE